MGRNTVLTDEVQERILNAVRGGNWLDTAAGYAGVSPSSLHEWLARGRNVNRGTTGHDEPQPCPACGAEGEDPCLTATGKKASRPHTVRLDRPGGPTETDLRYAAFAEEVEKARAQSEVRALTHIQQAALDGTWQAAAWFLERSHPQRWGRRRMEHVGPDGGPVQVDVSVEALNDRLEALLEEEDDE